MPIRLFTPAERPSSADMNRYFMQQHHVIKTSNETVTSSTSTQNDDQLIIPVEANTNYWMLGAIYYDCTGTADFKIGWNFPVGTTMNWGFDGITAGETQYNSCTVSRAASLIGTTPVAGGVAVNTQGTIIPKGLVQTGGTAGNLIFKWAQNVSEATVLTVRSGSLLILRRLTS